VNQHELLTALDNWTPWWDSEATVSIMQLAAAEIRRLQTSVSTVQREGEYVNMAIGTAETGQ
jgi:hypothetical protein